MQHLNRDDSLRPRLWPAKQRIPRGISWYICYTSKSRGEIRNLKLMKRCDHVLIMEFANM